MRKRKDKSFYSFKVKFYIDYILFTRVFTINYMIKEEDKDFITIYNEVIKNLMAQLDGNAVRITDKRGKTFIFDRCTIKRITVKEKRKNTRINIYETLN